MKMSDHFYIPPKNTTHYLVAGSDMGIILITKYKNVAYEKHGKFPESEVFIVTDQAYASIIENKIGYIIDPRLMVDCINNVIHAYGCAAPLYWQDVFIGIGNADNIRDNIVVAYIDRVGYISIGRLCEDRIFRRFGLSDNEKVESRGKFDFSRFAHTVGGIKSEQFRCIMENIPDDSFQWDGYEAFVMKGHDPCDFWKKYIGTYSCVNDFLSDNEDRYGIKSVHDMNESVEIIPVGHYFWKGEPKKLLKSFPEYGW